MARFNSVCVIFFFASSFPVSWRRHFSGIVSSFIVPLPRTIFWPKYKKLPPNRRNDTHRTAKAHKKKKRNKKNIRRTLKWKLIFESLDIWGMRQFWFWICSVEDMLSEVQRGVCFPEYRFCLAAANSPNQFSKNFEKKLKLQNFKAEILGRGVRDPNFWENMVIFTIWRHRTK